MTYSDPKLSHFSLRGRSILDLRDLARQYLQRTESEINGLTKTELVSELSEAAANNTALAKDLRKHGISFKPSFYLMRFSQHKKHELSTARSLLRNYLKKHSVGLTELQVQLVEEPKASMTQVFFTWHSSHHYWSPEFELKQVDQLQFGLLILDHTVGKAIVCCHSVKERDEICNIIGKALDMKFSSLVLTRPLLDQIGTFDRVKRASYVISKPDPTTPMNITYADENLRHVSSPELKKKIQEANDSRRFIEFP
jgi:hypothetical protein